MLDRTTFQLMKDKYEFYSSWAVWADEGSTPKSNIGDLSVLDPDINESLLTSLNPNIILVALNISRGDIQYPLANFHDKRSEATDYKLRFALRGTKLWGAYLTDIIKDFDQKISGKVISFLKENPDFEKQNIEYFLNEISDLGVKDPSLVALGTPTFDILNRNLSDRYTIIKIRHYAFRENKEKYREHVEEVCSKYL